jgi:hypothetical protein
MKENNLSVVVVVISLVDLYSVYVYSFTFICVVNKFKFHCRDGCWSVFGVRYCKQCRVEPRRTVAEFQSRMPSDWSTLHFHRPSDELVDSINTPVDRATLQLTLAGRETRHSLKPLTQSVLLSRKKETESESEKAFLARMVSVSFNQDVGHTLESFPLAAHPAGHSWRCTLIFLGPGTCTRKGAGSGNPCNMFRIIQPFTTTAVLCNKWDHPYNGCH